MRDLNTLGKICLVFVFFLALILSHPDDGFAQNPRNVLRVGKTTRSDLTPKVLHDYYVSLKAGQFASVKVRQISIGIFYMVFDPKGTLIEISDFNGINYSERISIDATVDGDYKIQVGWDYGEPRTGSYEISLNKLEKLAKDRALRTEQLLNSWYDLQSPGAGVAIIKDKKVLFKRFKGLANVEHNVPVTSSTVFEMASVSKQFTGFAIAMLVDKGVLSLDDDIRKYLPEVPDFGRKITIDHLIHHTSGIRDWTYCFKLAGYEVRDASNIRVILNFVDAQKQLNFAPGDAMSYSNTGYNLLAVIVERATKQPFASWMRENIFTPLGMKSTSIRGSSTDTVLNAADSYASDGSPIKTSAGAFAAYGSSSVYSNIDDLVRWVINFEDQSVGSPNVFKLIERRGVLNNGTTLDYAFGNTISTYKKNVAVTHLGLALGYRTAIKRYPNQHLSVIYLANDGNDATYRRADKIAELYLQGLESEPSPTMPEFPDVDESTEKSLENPELINYIGTYYSEELGTVYDLKVFNGKLTAFHARINPIVLTYSKPNMFSASSDFMQEIEFVRDTKNRVIGYKVSNGSDRNIIFDKLKKFDE